MKKFLTILLISAPIIIALLIFFSLSPSVQDNRQVLAASIPPIASLTETIAGDEFRTVSMLPPGASPHTFEPTPRLITELESAEIAFLIGYGIDDWAEELLPKQAKAVTVDSDIDLRDTEHESDEHADDADHDHEDDHDEQEGMDGDDHDHDHGPIDPHYWLSFENAGIIANTITAELSRTYPESSEIFEANNAELQSDLRLAKEAALAELATIENHNIITMHEAWYYFAEEMNLTIAGAFEPSPGKEPSPSLIAELSELVEETGVQTIYSEVQLGKLAIEAFASDNNITIAELDPMGGTNNRMSFLEMMQFNVETIKNNQ